MARDYNHNRIVMIRLPDRSSCAGLADSLCNFAIGCGFTVRNPRELIPNSESKWSAIKAIFQIEGFSFMVEILVNLLCNMGTTFLVPD